MFMARANASAMGIEAAMSSGSFWRCALYSGYRTWRNVGDVSMTSARWVAPSSKAISRTIVAKM